MNSNWSPRKWTFALDFIPSFDPEMHPVIPRTVHLYVDVARPKTVSRICRSWFDSYVSGRDAAVEGRALLDYATFGIVPAFERTAVRPKRRRKMHAEYENNISFWHRYDRYLFERGRSRGPGCIVLADPRSRSARIVLENSSTFKETFFALRRFSYFLSLFLSFLFFLQYVARYR